MTQRSNTLLKIKSIYPSFKPAERRVADYVLRSPKRVVHVSITELAKASKVSDATVVKFCKRLGYQGFQEFKILLAQDIVVTHTLVDGEVEPGDDSRTIKEKVFRANICALQDTIQVQDDLALERAIDALTKAREIHFYGLGSSSIAAFDGEQKFSRIGRWASAFADTHMQISRAVLLQPGDVAIGLTHSGETREIVEALETAKARGATTIAITNHSTSRAAQVADLLLLTCSRGDLFTKEGISSRIAQLATIDTLFVAVALADFKRSQEVLDKTSEILSQR
ncbi:MAG: MurR/RpiR family transcriptional regulator [Firmicutes bacterium]|nr:MurR/RpiR family transcriptional regulator [Bacillota bacterium]